MPNALGNLDLRLALQQIPEYVVLLNTDGEIIFFNKEAERLQREANRPIELGTSFLSVVDPERKNIFSETFDQLKEGKTVVTLDASFKDVNNSNFFFEVNYVPIVDDDQLLKHICILAREVTPQKIYEKKTNQLVHELSLLIEDANAIVFGVDGLGYITDWNKESVRITQFDKAEVFTHKIRSLIKDSDRLEFDHLLERSLQGDLVSNQELHIKTKDKTITVLVNASPKRNNLGDVIGVLFVGQDITELANYRRSLEEKVHERTESLKKALEKEKELVDIKNKFVSIASHEFKMPLAAIGSSTNSIKSGRELPKSDLEHVTVIERQVAIMRSILEDVLTLGKNDSNKLKAKLERIDIVSFLKTLSDEIELGTGKTHRVVKSFSHSNAFIIADEKLLRNIFSNILSNAIKFSPQKKEIRLQVHQNQSQIIVQVQDDGIGIQKDDLKRVFEPFNRGANADDIKGTGLGLSIVKKATETLGGKLEMESEIGMGTTIRIIFDHLTDAN
jgi:PAS domain S-box-containing protein